MPCPRCRSTVIKEFDADYFSCPQCGELVAKTAEIIPERPEPEKGKGHIPETKTLTYDVCFRFKDSIISQRKDRTSWATITNLLKKALNVKINEKSVQKYALKIIGYDPFPV